MVLLPCVFYERMVSHRNELQLIVNHLIAILGTKLLSMGEKQFSSSYLGAFAVFLKENLFLI